VDRTVREGDGFVEVPFPGSPPPPAARPCGACCGTPPRPTARKRRSWTPACSAASRSPPRGRLLRPVPAAPGADRVESRASRGGGRRQDHRLLQEPPCPRRHAGRLLAVRLRLGAAG
jgi:hypothetical protein